MTSRVRRRGANWGHVTFVSMLAMVSGLYLVDTLSVSTRMNNIILILPVAALVILLYLFVIAHELIRLSPARSNGAHAEADTQPGSGEAQNLASAQPDNVRAAIGLVVALGVYVTLYPYLGLDLATLLFMSIVLRMLGMRNLLVIVLYAIIFTVVVVGGAKLLLPYPMPMMLS